DTKQGLDQGRLAGAVLPEQAENLPLVHAQRDALERLDLAELFDQVARFDDGHVWHPRDSSCWHVPAESVAERGGRVYVVDGECEAVSGRSFHARLGARKDQSLSMSSNAKGASARTSAIRKQRRPSSTANNSGKIWSFRQPCVRIESTGRVLPCQWARTRRR